MASARTALITFGLLTGLAAPAWAAVAVHPTGVNVNSQGATTVFLTYGGLVSHLPAEAFWCGQLQPATPAIGFRCDPSTIFGSLPIRYDQSRLSGTRGFTDIMSIPASVARRAYQAAEAGATSSFFYVRRFAGIGGAPDEYVVVTCRMAGGGARVPLALTHVALRTARNEPVVFVKRGEAPPDFSAEITHTGTGRLQGRWEVVMPGEELPSVDDLLTEATLPVELRGTQARYTQIERFNIFLPPNGRARLPGPDPARLPTAAEGAYYVLLRVEASNDKEGDSDLSAAGAGSGVVRSGGVAGFPMPVLRYVVGSAETVATVAGGLAAIAPGEDATTAVAAIDFSWAEDRQAVVYRLEIRDIKQQPIHAALLPAGAPGYRAPAWIRDKAPAGIEWRVVALGPGGDEMRASAWRRLRFVRSDR